jgi:hypothetical protein
MYRIGCFYFGKRGHNFWSFLTPQEGHKENSKEGAKERPKVCDKSETSESQTVSNQSSYSIVGKSQTVYLDEPAKVETPQSVVGEPVEPVFSEDLQPVTAYEDEPDITPEDVDDSLQEEDLSPEDRFLPLDTEIDNEHVSTGMTYEQISQAVEAVQGKKMSDAGRQAAARTLYDVQGSDVYDFLVMQAENEAAIERLLKENLDDSGEVTVENRAPKRTKTDDFDMDKYV